jgi:hypothetical protein
MDPATVAAPAPDARRSAAAGAAIARLRHRAQGAAPVITLKSLAASSIAAPANSMAYFL